MTRKVNLAVTQVRQPDAVIIGTGFAGLYAIHKFRNVMGMEVQAYETGDGVGGTWYWNRYPRAL